MTLFDTFGLVSEESHLHVPTSYIIALIAILFTSISYGHMIRRYPSSGSAYTYAQNRFTRILALWWDGLHGLIICYHQWSTLSWR